MNPTYERNIELDAKIVSASYVGGANGMLKAMSEMNLWSTPQEAVNYARNIQQQPQEYRSRVAKLAAQLIGLVS